jgi:hypothetical protein
LEVLTKALGEGVDRAVADGTAASAAASSSGDGGGGGDSERGGGSGGVEGMRAAMAALRGEVAALVAALLASRV